MTEQMQTTQFRGQISFTPEGSEAAEQIRKTPEGRFLWAILENGIEQYKKNATTTSRRGHRLFHEAEEWIIRDDPTWICSFVNICHVLGFDPDYLRTGLMQWCEAQRARMFKQAA